MTKKKSKPVSKKKTTKAKSARSKADTKKTTKTKKPKGKRGTKMVTPIAAKDVGGLESILENLEGGARFRGERRCVPPLEAGPLVMGCSPQPFNVETKLGVAFPSAERREQFCRCVSERSGVPRANIPCGPNNTFRDVIIAISC